MKQIFIHQKNSPRLILFFAGWGMDTNPFRTIDTVGSDLLVCCDYRTLEVDNSLWSGYDEVVVVAWSMGVWAATHVLAQTTLPIVQSIAINGTPYPIDDQRGISRAVFEGTIQGLNEESLRKFQRRMCGSSSAYQRFLSVAPQRSASELKEELIAIEQAYTTLPETTFCWNKALVGTSDRIFWAENQLSAWSGEIEVIQVEAPHYAEALFRPEWWEGTPNKNAI